MARDGISSEAVRRSVQAYVADHRLAAGARLPSLRFFAEQTGASLPTVQHAVRQLVAEGVLSSRVGSGTFVAAVPGSGGLIGVMSPHMTNRSGEFINDLYTGICRELQAAGFGVLNMEPAVADPAGDEINAVRQLIELGVRGLIVFSFSLLGDGFWRFVRSLDVPLVCCNNADACGELDLVTSDNYGGGRAAAEHLLRFGHRELAVLCTGLCETLSERDRIRGFVEAGMSSGGGTVRIINTKDGDPGKILLREQVTGVFAVNDFTAVRTLNELRGLGVEVPQQMSLIGYDNTPVSAVLQPALATFDQQSLRMGKLAARMLLENIALAPEERLLRQYRVPPKFIGRDSIGAAPARAAAGNPTE